MYTLTSRTSFRSTKSDFFAIVNFMRNSTYIGLTLNFPGFNNSRPFNQLKKALDDLYFANSHKPHQWFLTANGRTAIYLFLKSLNLTTGSEVLVQSFTCVTAINPILWAGLVPVYVDIDPDTLSASLESLTSHITPRTKVIMLQHTFGLPGALEHVQELAKKHGLLLIEDCAHALGLNINNQALGTFGDAAIISFGIEKSLSTKLGGALLVNNPHLIREVESDYHDLPELPRWQSFLWLIYPALRQLLRKIPTLLSNPLRRLLQVLRLLKQAVAKPEYAGGIPSHTLATLPGVHAKIVLDALNHINPNLNHRLKLAELYQSKIEANPGLTPAKQSTAYIKYPVICQSTELRDYLVATLAAKAIYVSNWYSPPIYPAGVDYITINYQPSGCPIAESVASRIINLPTGPNITESHATMIANEVNTAAFEFTNGAGTVPSST